MFEIKDELKSRVWFCENDGEFMMYDRNTGNVHFAKDENELKNVQEKLMQIPNVSTVFQESKDNSFKINLSTVCNLHCDYCFRDKESHITTNVATAKKIIDYILDVYAPGLDFYSFAFNMTSEALFELQKMKQIKSYLDERLNIYFDSKDVTSVKVGFDYLNCFDSALTGNLENYNSVQEIIDKLNDLLKMKNLKNYFSVPEGMIIPEWEKNQLANIENLTEKETVLANRRFLEVLFPDCFKHKANYVFYICTNGTICSDEVIKFFREIGLKRICVSLDGPAAVHNKHRYFYNGNVSHVPVLKNIKKFMAEGFEIEVACVITRDFLKPLKLVEYFKELNVSAVGMNVVRAGKGASLDRTDVEELLSGYKDLFNRIYCDAVKGDYSLIRLLQNDICFAAVKHVLGKGRLVKRCKWNEELIFDSKGDIYPCDYFVGKNGFVRGSIDSAKLKEIGKGKLFVDEREPCKDCWCKFMCAGTCFYNSYIKTGDLSCADPVECLLNKGIRELGLNLVHRLYLAGVNLYEFGKNIGFDFDKKLNFTRDFFIKNGISYEFRDSLAGFEKELKKMFLFLENKKFRCESKIFVSVKNIEDYGPNKLIDFNVMIPTDEEIKDSMIEETKYLKIKDFHFGSCISVKGFSKDEEMEELKSKLYSFVEKFRVPVKGHFVYVAEKSAFLEKKETPIQIFLCQMKDVM